MFGSGPAWAAALEAALLLKEVAGIPAEGVETREGATSAMMALRPGALALSLPTGADDPLLDRGGGDLRRAGGAPSSEPPAARTPIDGWRRCRPSPPRRRCAHALGIARGLDVDRPAWTEAYYRVARRTA